MKCPHCGNILPQDEDWIAHSKSCRTMEPWEDHQYRSCTRKVRFASEPSAPKNMSSYHCEFCKGWHLATKRHGRNGDLSYTKEGWPIVSSNKGRIS